jgi:hypothetical protein
MAKAGFRRVEVLCCRFFRVRTEWLFSKRSLNRRGRFNPHGGILLSRRDLRRGQNREKADNRFFALLFLTDIFRGATVK